LGSKVTIPLVDTKWEGEGEVKVKYKDSETGEKFKEAFTTVAKLKFDSNRLELDDLIEDSDLPGEYYGEIEGLYLIDEDSKFSVTPTLEELEEFVEDLLDLDIPAEITIPKVKIKMKFKLYEDDPLRNSYVKVKVSLSFEAVLGPGAIIQGKYQAKHELYLKP